MRNTPATKKSLAVMAAVGLSTPLAAACAATRVSEMDESYRALVSGEASASEKSITGSQEATIENFDAAIAAIPSEAAFPKMKATAK